MVRPEEMTAARGSLLARLPAAGLAIPTIVTLTLWQSNVRRLPYEDALPTLGVVLALAALFTAALRWLTGSWVRAGILAGIVSAYLLYAPSMLGFLGESPWLLGLALLLVGIATFAVIRRVPRDRAALLDANRKLNLIVLSATLLIGGLAVFELALTERKRPAIEPIFAPFEGRAAADSPDVWHILFDRYGSSDTLGRVYGHDNRPFLDALRQRGFEVREPAFANYQRTAHSVASTLNGAYLDPLAERMRRNPRDWVPLYRTMTDNEALRFFNASGYRTYFAGSWWNPTRYSPLADRNVNYRALPELARLLIDQSVPGFLLRPTGLPFADSRTDQCRRARFKFDRLRALAANSERKYVFAHFLLPHPPFVINADGSCRSLAVADRATRSENYVQQVRYANGEALRLIDAILAGPRPAVIVLHSDEGPWPEPHVGDERFPGRDPVDVDWTRLAPGQLNEKMGILLAVRYADGAARPAPESPVDIYPAILQAHFGATPAARPARHLVFRSDDALYAFDDVTGRLP